MRRVSHPSEKTERREQIVKPRHTSVIDAGEERRDIVQIRAGRLFLDGSQE